MPRDVDTMWCIALDQHVGKRDAGDPGVRLHSHCDGMECSQRVFEGSKGLSHEGFIRGLLGINKHIRIHIDIPIDINKYIIKHIYIYIHMYIYIDP